MSRFLCTTALEETWRDDVPVLFLGEWCRRHTRRAQWLRLDAEVLPYHWDDRTKLEADYRYLSEFYERLLVDLAARLNEIHGVAHGVRYWRILIGPWLGYFVQILFDRWECIQQAARAHPISGTTVLCGQEASLVPNDMVDFSRLMSGDEWNHQLYAAILRQFTTIACHEQARPEPPEVTAAAAPAAGWKRGVRRVLVACYSRVARMLSRDRDAFFLNTYLPLPQEVELQRRFGQIPQMWRSVTAARSPVDFSRRLWSVPGASHSQFEACARALIPQQIPAAYLEGYPGLLRQVAGLPWPQRPKVIWTSNSYGSDDVFKAWAAQKCERGAPLAVGQHGGHYGTGRWSFGEDHEIAISDCYLTWGWSEPGSPRLRPVGQLKALQPLGVTHAKQARALLVVCTLPRFSYWMYSVLVSSQWLSYLDDQVAFAERLPQRIQDSLTLRLFPTDFGWDQVARYRERLPNIHQDDGRCHLNDLVRRSRVYISTYNATNFLESFAMDVPTVMFWNPRHWELRDSAIPYFEELRRVGIFHETPQSAADHVAAIWDDVDAWWTSRAVREVLQRFKERYSRVPRDLLTDVERVLRDVAATRDESVAR